MEDDARLEHVCADGIGRSGVVITTRARRLWGCAVVRGVFVNDANLGLGVLFHPGGFRILPMLSDSMASVLGEEGKECAGDRDGAGGAFVAKLAKAGVGEHQEGMGEELRT